MHGPPARIPSRPMVTHHVQCVHQPEIELWPAWAEVYFRDERYIDLASAQARFDATVYNTPSRGVLWNVQRSDGSPGAGAVDASGLYTAPDKGALASGTTEYVVATAADDPLRKAFARITLIGRGPEPPPQPRIEIVPRQLSLYFKTGGDNAYIDGSNKRQLFKVEFHHTPQAQIKWVTKWEGGSNQPATTDPWFLYDGLSLPSPGVQRRLVTVTASLVSDPSVSDTATIMVHNYHWPPLD